VTQTTKTCSGCTTAKPLAEFYRSKRSGDGYQYRCKDCSRSTLRKWQEDNREHHNLATSQWRQSNPDAIRAHKRKWKYGLTQEAFDALMDAQGGTCAICGVIMAPPCVDHCHSSGRVRGLLCSPCNLGIGQMRDDPSILIAAADYLRAS
jgi:hypothetical protein